MYITCTLFLHYSNSKSNLDMGHDGHHGSKPPYVVPDYRIYKVENAPELLRTQRALASIGLKDPWIRNEVWRYNVKVFGTMKERCKSTFLTGFRTGFIAFLITIGGTAIYDRFYPPKHDHDHH